jgi:hypothetical protein
MKERIDKIKQTAGPSAGALVAARYKQNISYQPTEITAIAVVAEGSAGLTESAPAKGEKKEEPKKSGFGLGALKKTVAPEKQSAQVSGSGGARGVGADRLAKGGDNPNPVKVTVSAAEIEAFRKGIA